MLAEEPYNVLFIAADDLRTDLGCYGNSLVKTPNLDRLAASGMVFQSAYCQQSLCNPSGSDLPQSDHPIPTNLASDRKCECRDLPDEAYYDRRVAELAVQALRERAKAPQAQGSQPFFLAVGFWKPHSPFNAPKRYWDMYSLTEITAPENSQWPRDTPRISWHNSREILGEGETARELSPEATREIRHGYLAQISSLDAQVGKVLDELDRLKLTEKTIVVFWSDHGFHLGEHRLWAKTGSPAKPWPANCMTIGSIQSMKLNYNESRLNFINYFSKNEGSWNDPSTAS